MTLKRPFSRMLADMSGKVLAACKDHPTITKALALKYSSTITRRSQCCLCTAVP